MIMEFIKANMIVILGIAVPAVVIFCLAVLITIFVRRKTSSNEEEASENSTVNLDDSVKPYPIWRSPCYQPTPMLQATANIFSSFVPTPLPPPALMQVVSPTGASIKTSVLTYLSPARLGIKRASTFGRGDARFMSHRYTVK